MVYLTFVSNYNAVHRLWNEDMSEEENVKLYGECANASGHGHLYRIQTTVAAAVSAADPVVLGRTTAQRLIDSVLAPKLRNADMDNTFGIAGFISTGENVARAIWRLLEAELPRDVALVAVKVVETPKNSFTYTGESVVRRVPAQML